MGSETPPAVERTIRILELLATNSSSLSIKEISEQLSIPHATTYRIVKSLLDFGYIRECQFSRNKYKLGYKLIYLADSIRSENDLVYTAKPYIRTLSEKTGHACQLCILLSDCVTIIEQVIPKNSITIIANLWEHLPINRSASGKLLVSLLPPDERKLFMKKAWKNITKTTPYTKTDLNVFMEEIEETSKRLYATDYEEYAVGIGCLAAPIYDYSGSAIAALGLTGHVVDYKNKERFEFMLQALFEAAEAVSKNLGYTEPYRKV